MNNISNKSAVIYARVSSIGDRQNTNRQVADLQDYATKNDYTVEAVYEEHISGATKNENRPVLCECLDYCLQNHIHTLLISELSRLGRNVDEVLANVRLCKDNNINIYFQKEGLNIFQPDGSKNPFLTIFISVLGTCAELEREAIIYRLQSGRANYKAKGGRLGRKEGYRKPLEQKREEYKAVFKELRRGTSIRRTALLTGVSTGTIKRLKKEFGL